MPEESSLHDRITALEQSRTRPAGGDKRLRALFLLTLLVLCGFVCVQGWLISAHFNRIRANEREHLFWLVCQRTAGPPERKEAFLQLAETGHGEWRSAHLKKLDLKGVDLSGTLLLRADLEASDLSGSRLIGTNLSLANLALADLTKVDLSNAGLAEANLLRAHVDGANFRQANLRAANLEQTTATSAIFILADLSDATLLMADLTDADLAGAKLNGADLESAILRRTQLALTDFSGAVLKNTDFTNSNWWRARGFTTEQIAELRKKFPPGEGVEETMRNDYARWLEGVGAGE